MGVKELVQESYPSLAFLLKDPEIGKLLTQAVDPNKGFSPQTFQAKLYQTKWWKTKSNSQREWLIKSKTDPGSAKQERGTYGSKLASAASQYGVKLSGAQLKWLTEVGLASQWEPGGEQMMYELSKLRNGKSATGGAVRTTAREVQQMARRDYAYGMSNKNAAKWADQIVRGLKSPEDMKAAVADRAASLFPQFKTGLAQGQTIADMTDSYREIIASELEIDPERIDLSRGRWSKVLNWRDSKGLRAPTAQEVQKLARMDPRWWKTSNGRQTDAEMTRGVLGLFGKRTPMGMGGGK